MPLVPFNQLPDDARLWVFAASDPVTGDRVNRLLDAVDEWLENWKAHGEPLTCARDWRDDRFLTIGVDQSTAGASGCSIDALFRVFQRLQHAIGTSMLGGGRVFYRNSYGDVVGQSRAAFSSQAASGSIGAETLVFDTSITTARAFRTEFERRAADSWHRELLTANTALVHPPQATSAA